VVDRIQEVLILRPKTNVRRARSVQAAIALIMLAVPASALALTSTASSDTHPAPTTSALSMRVAPRQPRFNQPVVVSGVAPASDVGHSAIVEATWRGQPVWRVLGDARVGSGGHFRLTGRLRRSGYVRVIDVAAPVATAAVGTSLTPPSGATASAPVPVNVAARFSVPQRSRNVLGGSPVVVRGRLMPGRSHRAVRLQGRVGRGWRTVASARTGAAGSFRLRFVPSAGLQRGLRVVFAGDPANARSVARVGQLTVYGQDVASWYYDAGNTACGFHAGFGVANRTLPCGTKVRFRYGGRSVTATVDDRGPFVGGRNWDLNQNTAGALGFGGVGTVWVSIG
jgi:hypothetical protein